MFVLAYLFQSAVLAFCLLGIGLLGKRLRPALPFCLSLCLTPLILVMVGFWTEHYLALGQLQWFWIPLALYTCWAIRADNFQIVRESATWYFLAGFGFCFIWRISFPNVDIDSERLADYAHLASHCVGAGMPAEDIWVKGAPDDSYYILQYYAAGLIHRLFGCSVGLTYQLGYCVLTAYSAAAMGYGVERATRSRIAPIVALLCLFLGGTGTDLLTPFMLGKGEAILPFQTMRFAGSFAMFSDDERQMEFSGLKRAEKDAQEAQSGHPLRLQVVRFLGESPVEAPVEYFSYLIFLGDYHPSLCAMLFACLCVLAIGVAESIPPPPIRDAKRQRIVLEIFLSLGVLIIALPIFLLLTSVWLIPLKSALVVGWVWFRHTMWLREEALAILHAPAEITTVTDSKLPHHLEETKLACIALAIATPIFLIIANPWVFPLQGALVAGWLLYRYAIGHRDSLRWIFISTAIPLCLIYPFFIRFAYAARSDIKFAMVIQQVPILTWIVIWLPVLILIVGMLAYIAVSGRRSFVTFAGIAATAFVIFSYYFCIHDIYSDRYEIFNTTLKWWSWIFNMSLVLGTMALWPQKWGRRVIYLATFTAVAGNIYMYGGHWITEEKPAFGQMEGDAWFNEDHRNGVLLTLLKAMPRGTVLQKCPLYGACPAFSVAEFAGQYSVGGWTSHEQLWRPGRLDLEKLRQDREAFYIGKMTDPLPWLGGITPGGVTYIAWLTDDNLPDPANWDRVNDAIKEQYDWRQVDSVGPNHIGFWVRRPGY